MASPTSSGAASHSRSSSMSSAVVTARYLGVRLWAT
jgi:hypothetical protein